MAATASSAVVRNLQLVRAKVTQATAASAWKQSVGSATISTLSLPNCCLSHVMSPLQHQCTLVAVSKTKPVEDLRAAYEHEQRHFGENYVRLLFVVCAYVYVGVLSGHNCGSAGFIPSRSKS